MIQICCRKTAISLASRGGDGQTRHNRTQGGDYRCPMRSTTAAAEKEVTSLLY